MNSLRSRPEYVVENNLCDAPFIHYIDCLKKAMEGKDIDIEELRSYHSEKIGSKDEPLTK
ncbi:Hypothetical protein CINCED_3A010316 [Cinara cedri]|nr:Hypothetical protein CINCED_3A010316 [Cinara cedri]